ncbi:MAG: cytochrome c, partial [Gammaproteobacteria bacterium]|nr:cytochrome c [Gammaproteobacteria bacterium]
YTAYSQMTVADMRALFAYLQSVPAVEQVNREHETAWYVSRPTVAVWRGLYFAPGEFAIQESRDAQWNRGRYLTSALGHCAECHTPRNRFGALIETYHFQGAPYGDDGEAPNITACEAGIGDWSKRELRYFLEEGLLPDDDYVGSIMAEVVEESFEHMSAEDREAMIVFLTDESLYEC